MCKFSVGTKNDWSSLHFVTLIENLIKKNLTCKMVSKLNVNPFQRVNSPDEAPVTNLRPSGVQAMQNIGHLILLVAAFTKRVVTALIALSSYAGGG